MSAEVNAISICASELLAERSRKQFNSALAERNNCKLSGPALFLSREKVRDNLRELSSALPGVEIHYAIKSNNHPAILKVILDEGHRFDVCSVSEIDKTFTVGATINDLLHTHPIKSHSEIEGALERGITTFVVDNTDEIAKFRQYGKQVRLIVRFRALDADQSAEVVQCNLSFKFGCSPEEVKGLVSEIIDSGVGYAGLAFHVGSQCLSVAPYLKGINFASDIITELDSEGVATGVLDIGGGFPVEYTESVPAISVFCEPITNALRSLIPAETKVICEPGRFISASAVTLLVNVIGKSSRGSKPWYYVDDGVYGSFSGRIYDQCDYRTLTNRNSTWIPSTLAGPTCDSIDVIYDEILLPPLDIGDTLVFPALGAYSSVSASGFNSLPPARTIIVD